MAKIIESESADSNFQCRLNILDMTSQIINENLGFISELHTRGELLEESKKKMYDLPASFLQGVVKGSMDLVDYNHSSESYSTEQGRRFISAVMNVQKKIAKDWENVHKISLSPNDKNNIGDGVRTFSLELRRKYHQDRTNEESFLYSSFNHITDDMIKTLIASNKEQDKELLEELFINDDFIETSFKIATLPTSDNGFIFKDGLANSRGESTAGPIWESLVLIASQSKYRPHLKDQFDRKSYDSSVLPEEWRDDFADTFSMSEWLKYNSIKYSPPSNFDSRDSTPFSMRTGDTKGSRKTGTAELLYELNRTE